MAKTHVMYNGSKFAGKVPTEEEEEEEEEAREGLEALLKVLASEPLDSRYADFEQRLPIGSCLWSPDDPEILTHHFFGNFRRVSHAFSVFTNDENVITKLREACEKNMASDAYREGT